MTKSKLDGFFATATNRCRTVIAIGLLVVASGAVLLATYLKETGHVLIGTIVVVVGSLSAGHVLSRLLVASRRARTRAPEENGAKSSDDKDGPAESKQNRNT